MQSVSGAPNADLLNNDNSPILDLDCAVSNCLRSKDFPKTNFGVPLAGSLIPWIDKPMPNGQTKEEWKGGAEANKIMGIAKGKEIPIDGQCVRIGAMRSHSQAVTLKLTHDVPMDQIEKAIKEHNQWVKLVPNNKEDTITQLTPAFASGTLTIPVGRLRKMILGPEYLTCFTVGDQLLWGAAEPVRRMLKISLDHIRNPEATSQKQKASMKKRQAESSSSKLPFIIGAMVAAAVIIRSAQSLR